MASNVVVIDSTARRATVKTTPGTHLSEVLEEACRKLGYKPDQFGLKHNNKQVDLSRTYRLSGLASGAKLELVQLSKSVGVVTVAVQLPQSEAQGVPNARLTDKFPSNTTLWLLLRKFEAGVAGGSTSNRNFTARAVPSAGSGAGRLFYEQPVVHAMQRELSTFKDLQKTLAQLGLNSGNALLRLSFKPTECPLEDALHETQAYFDSLEGPPDTQPTQQVPAAALSGNKEESTSTPPTIERDEKSTTDTNMPGVEPTSESTPADAAPGDAEAPVSTQPTENVEEAPSPTSRPVSVFRPPTGTTPSAALSQHNEADFTPTVEHAQAHQKMLNEASRNRRLKTDSELAAVAKEEEERLAAVKEVEIKIRFPDQSALGTKFKQSDTGSTLYAFVREECLDPQLKTETFVLGVPGGAGKGHMEVIPDNQKRLIQELHLKGRVLLVFAWDEQKASLVARGTKNVLRAELRARAEDIKVPNAPASKGPEEQGTRVQLGGTEGEKSEGSGGGIGKKMPKWLKGLSKK